MSGVPPILIAGTTGFLSGLLLSVPVGPVNLTIINEGARRGFQFAFLMGLGASLMEVIYCYIAFTGFASFFSQGTVKAVMEVFSFAFMMFFGVKFLMTQTVPTPTRVETRIERRFHPHSAFMTGFVRVMGNPGVLLTWIIFSANFISREWVRPSLQSKGVCVLGVALGTSLWFTGVSYAVSRGRGKFSEQTLLRLEHCSGLGLLIFGVIHGCQIVGEIIKAHH
jgi:threonine/homoserine/homoserine lactone efflux protein